jgi:hypothetical protein
MTQSVRLVTGSLVCLASFACGPDVATLKKDAVKQYAKVASQMYGDTLTSAKAMQTSINAFVADPTEANLTAAKDLVENRGSETGAWRGEVHGGTPTSQGRGANPDVGMGDTTNTNAQGPGGTGAMPGSTRRKKR